MKRTVIVVAIILAACIGVAYFSFNRIFIYIISKTSGLDITYDRITDKGLSGCTITNLRAVYKKSGAGITAREAKLKTLISPGICDNLGLEMETKDLFFVLKGKKESLDYDNPPNLIMIPFRSNQKYEKISTTVTIFKDKISVKAFNAYSDDIRFNFKGDILNNDKIFGDIKIYFSDNILKKIPEPLVKQMLTDEGGGWKSLSVSIEGDYKSPAVQLSSKLFRLNIKSVSVNSD